MKVVLGTLSALLLLVVLAACGSQEGDPVAEDPGPSPSSDAAPPKAPVPDGEVRTTGLVTVIDGPKQDGPEVCLGPIAESYPPMCSGPALLEWDWDEIGRGISESEGETRWGSYALSGTWDGEALTATSAIPAALYDPAPIPSEPPSPGGTLTLSVCEDLDVVVEELTDLPFALGASAADCTVQLDVVYDDGSVQAWADATYGAGLVQVRAALVDAG